MRQRRKGEWCPDRYDQTRSEVGIARDCKKNEFALDLDFQKHLDSSLMWTEKGARYGLAGRLPTFAL